MCHKVRSALDYTVNGKAELAHFSRYNTYIRRVQMSAVYASVLCNVTLSLIWPHFGNWQSVSRISCVWYMWAWSALPANPWPWQPVRNPYHRIDCQKCNWTIGSILEGENARVVDPPKAASSSNLCWYGTSYLVVETSYPVYDCEKEHQYEGSGSDYEQCTIE